MKRVLLFLVTNIAILLVLSIALSLLGFSGILDEQGVGLDLNALLLFAAVFGMGGAFVLRAGGIRDAALGQDGGGGGAADILLRGDAELWPIPGGATDGPLPLPDGSAE